MVTFQYKLNTSVNANSAEPDDIMSVFPDMAQRTGIW